MKQLVAALSLLLVACGSAPSSPQGDRSLVDETGLSEEQKSAARNAPIVLGKSVAGIELGTSQEVLLERFGRPEQVLPFTSRSGERWQYRDCAFEVHLEEGKVVGLLALVNLSASLGAKAYTGVEADHQLSGLADGQRVVDSLGPPVTVDRTEGAFHYSYPGLGATFAVAKDDLRLLMIMVYEPDPAEKRYGRSIEPTVSKPGTFDPHSSSLEPGQGVGEVRLYAHRFSATRALGSPGAVERRSDKDWIYYYGEHGLRVWFDWRGVSQIDVFAQTDFLGYRPFRGGMPAGLSPASTRAEVERALGPPDEVQERQIAEHPLETLVYWKPGLAFSFSRESGRGVFASVLPADPDYVPPWKRAQTLRAGGASLVVPGGAFGPRAEPIGFESSADLPSSSDLAYRVLSSYRLQNAPAVARKALTLTLPFDPSKLPAGARAEQVIPVLAAGKGWERVRGASVDAQGGSVTFSLRRVVPLINGQGTEGGPDPRFALVVPLSQQVLLERAPGLEVWASRQDEGRARQVLAQVKESVATARAGFKGFELPETIYLHLSRLDPGVHGDVAGYASGGDTITLNLAQEDVTGLVTVSHEVFHLAQQQAKIRNLSASAKEVSKRTVYRGQWLDEASAEYMAYSLLPASERGSKALGPGLEEFAFRGLLHTSSTDATRYPHQYQAFLLFCFLEKHYDTRALIRRCYESYLTGADEESETWDEEQVFQTVLASQEDRRGRKRDLRRLWVEFLLQFQWQKGFEPVSIHGADLGLGAPGKVLVPSAHLTRVAFPKGQRQRQWTLPRAPGYSLAHAFELDSALEEGQGEGDLRLSLGDATGATLIVFPRQGQGHGPPRMGSQVVLEKWHQPQQVMVWVVETGPQGSAKLTLKASYTGEGEEPPAAEVPAGEVLLALAVPPRRDGSRYKETHLKGSPPPPEAWIWSPGQAPARSGFVPAQGGPRVWSAEASSRGTLLWVTATPEGVVEFRQPNPLQHVPYTRAPVKKRLQTNPSADFGRNGVVADVGGIRWSATGDLVGYSQGQSRTFNSAELVERFVFSSREAVDVGAAPGTLVRTKPGFYRERLVATWPEGSGSQRAATLRWRATKLAPSDRPMLHVGPQGRQLAHVSNEGEAHVEIGTLSALRRVGEWKDTRSHSYQQGDRLRETTYDNASVSAIGWAQDGSAYYFVVQTERHQELGERVVRGDSANVMGQGSRAGVDYRRISERTRYWVVSSVLYRWTAGAGVKALHDLDYSVTTPLDMGAIFVSRGQTHLAVWGVPNGEIRKPLPYRDYDKRRDATPELAVIDLRTGRSRRILRSGSSRDYASFVRH